MPNNSGQQKVTPDPRDEFIDTPTAPRPEPSTAIVPDWEYDAERRGAFKTPRELYEKAAMAVTYSRKVRKFKDLLTPSTKILRLALTPMTTPTPTAATVANTSAPNPSEPWVYNLSASVNTPNVHPGVGKLVSLHQAQNDTLISHRGFYKEPEVPTPVDLRGVYQAQQEPTQERIQLPPQGLSDGESDTGVFVPQDTIDAGDAASARRLGSQWIITPIGADLAYMTSTKRKPVAQHLHNIEEQDPKDPDKDEDDRLREASPRKIWKKMSMETGGVIKPPRTNRSPKKMVVRRRGDAGKYEFE